MDFAHLASRGSIDAALSFFASNGIIRRVMVGLYEYPQYSTLLKRNVATDLHQTACALVRKFKWDIQPSGETALVVQALKAMEKAQMTKEFLTKLEPSYSKSVWEKIQKDASGSRDWIYETIKRLSEMSK